MNSVSVKVSGYSANDKISLVKDPLNRQATVINNNNKDNSSVTYSKNVIVDVNNDGKYTKGFDKVLLVKLPEPTEEELKPTREEIRAQKAGGVIFGGVMSAASVVCIGNAILDSVPLALASKLTPNKALGLATGLAIGGFYLGYKLVSRESALEDASKIRAIKDISDKVPNFVSPK